MRRVAGKRNEAQGRDDKRVAKRSTTVMHRTSPSVAHFLYHSTINYKPSTRLGNRVPTNENRAQTVPNPTISRPERPALLSRSPKDSHCLPRPQC